MSDKERIQMIEIGKKYEEAARLMKQQDPPSEPYCSKYAAAAIFEGIKQELTDLLDGQHESNDEETKKCTAMLGAVWSTLGSISAETEALSTSAEQLKNAVRILKQKPLDPYFVISLIYSLNQLGVLYSELQQPEESKKYLKESEKLYEDYKSQSVPVPNPFGCDLLFEPSPELLTGSEHKCASELEKNHTYTLYYLAQVYGTLGDNLKSAVYCHNTLRRQLESKDYDSIDWALNSATLSQFFMERNGFKQARHHLAAASHILDRYSEEQLKCFEGSDEEMEAKKEQFRHRSADVARCWAKYGLLLLGVSKDRLMGELPDETGGDLSDMIFPSLQIPTYENQVTCKFVLDYEDALPVFQSTKQWLDDAKTYYTLEEHASDYISLVQDFSALYRVLAFFENSEQRQCCMHKRRADQLEEVLSSVNHQCYLALVQQLWFELGEIYWEMVHLKLCIVRASGGDPTAPDPHVLNKLNMLTQKSIDNFEYFVDSILKQRSNGNDVFKLPEDMVRPVLIAHFYQGRLYARIVTPHKEVQLENNEKSLKCFKFIVNVCENDPEAAKLIPLELSVAKEMAELLPLKIDRLSAQIAFMKK